MSKYENLELMSVFQETFHLNGALNVIIATNVIWLAMDLTKFGQSKLFEVSGKLKNVRKRVVIMRIPPDTISHCCGGTI